MEIVKVSHTIEEIPFYQEKSAVTIGKFDGLHRGHMLLVEETVSKKERGFQAAVVAFCLPGQDALLTEDERIRMLENAGVDRLFILPYSKEILSTEAVDFVEELLIRRLNLSFLSVGEDFCFGKDRKGNAELLKKISVQKNFSLSVHPKVFLDGEEISSSLIKEKLHSGTILTANEMLGYAYSFSGTVIHGRALGRTLGFPTLNLEPPAEKLLPVFGVYHASVLLDGKNYHGVMNLGVRPSVETKEDEKPLIEVYLLDADGNFYGRELTVRLLSFIRAEQHFESLDALKSQVLSDIECVRCRIGEKSGLS